MSHVFICYAHADGDFAAELIRRIEEAGFDAWVDSEKLRAGMDWRKEIDQAIREAFALVVIVTPESRASEYVTYEWAFALGVGATVIPLLLEVVEKLHPRLEALHYLDFTVSRKARPWDGLFTALREAAGEIRPSTIPAGRSTPPAVRRAIEALNSPNPEERHTAIESLGQNRDPAAQDALAAAVDHDTWDVRVAASLKLWVTHHDARALPGLLEALKDANWGIRNAAAKALGQIGDPAAVPGLLGALEDAEPHVRQRAAEALGEIGDPAAMPELCEATQDEHKDVRQAAAKALGEIGGPAAVPALRKALEDTARGVREAAAGALVKIGPAAVPGLCEALKDANWDVCKVAAEALGEIGDPAAMPELCEALRDKHQGVREAAAEALVKIGPAAVPGLLEALKDTDGDVCKAAAEALGKIGGPAAVSGLTGALKDADPSVRWFVAEALDKIKNKAT